MTERTLRRDHCSAKMLQAGCDCAPESVPALPTRNRSIALPLVVRRNMPFAFRALAYGATIKNGQDEAVQDVAHGHRRSDRCSEDWPVSWKSGTCSLHFKN